MGANGCLLPYTAIPSSLLLSYSVGAETQFVAKQSAGHPRQRWWRSCPPVRLKERYGLEDVLSVELTALITHVIACNLVTELLMPEIPPGAGWISAAHLPTGRRSDCDLSRSVSICALLAEKYEEACAQEMC